MAQRFDKLNLRTSLVIGRTGHLDGAYPLDVWGQSRIRTGDSGGFTTNDSHDDLIIEGAGNTGLQLFSPNTSYQYIAFGDTDGSNSGYIRYYHGTNEMRLRTNGSDNLTITGSGNVGIGTTSPSSNLHVNGAGGSGVVTQIKVSQADDGAGHPGADAILQSSGWGEAYLKLGGHRAYAGGGDFNIESATDLALKSGGNNTRIFINSNGNVGIGTTSPSGKLDIQTSVNGSVALKLTSSITNDLSFNHYTGYTTLRDHSLSNNRILFFDSGKINMPYDLGVGLSGGTQPSYKLDISGTIRATGDIIAYSDARVKENVETVSNALDKVTAMRGVSYNKIGEEKRSVGVIAQELLEIVPEAVHQDENGMYSVAYGNLVGVLIEAMKEQQSQINELKAQINGITK